MDASETSRDLKKEQMNTSPTEEPEETFETNDKASNIGTIDFIDDDQDISNRIESNSNRQSRLSRDGFTEENINSQTDGRLDRLSDGDVQSEDNIHMITPYSDFNEGLDEECQYNPVPPGSTGIGCIRRTLGLCVELNQQNSTTPNTPPSYYQYPLSKEISNMNF